MLCYILCYASRKMPHSRRSAHKAPVMQSMQAKICIIRNENGESVEIRIPLAFNV